MNSGSLRHLATLDQPAEDHTFTPLDPPTWWCDAAGDSGGYGLMTLIGRYHPGITTATRVHLKGRIYHIDAVVSREERDVELVLTCREVFDT